MTKLIMSAKKDKRPHEAVSERYYLPRSIYKHMALFAYDGRPLSMNHYFLGSLGGNAKYVQIIKYTDW